VVKVLIVFNLYIFKQHFILQVIFFFLSVAYFALISSAKVHTILKSYNQTVYVCSIYLSNAQPSHNNALCIKSTTFALTCADRVTVTLCLRGCNCNSISRSDDTSLETIRQSVGANVNSTLRTMSPCGGCKTMYTIFFPVLRIVAIDSQKDDTSSDTVRQSRRVLT